MLNTFLSILPIFLLIVAGYIGKNYFLLEEVFWKSVDKLVYYVFFPSLLLLDISRANFDNTGTSTAIVATIGGTLMVAAFIFAGQYVIKVRNDLFTSIFQGGVRYNSYVFIALSQSLFGTEGVALSGVFIAYMIVITNVMSVLVMNHYGNGGKKSLQDTLVAIVKNPLIIAALLGLSINMIGLNITGAIKQFLGYLGSAATPLSLMSVGSGLMLSMQTCRTIATIYAVSLKLLIMPICTIILLGLRKQTRSKRLFTQ
ncbi:hypothetical protein AXE65_04980 [Ventosimonas gracilis]|uniref:Transporter n=1 Tax=Ventosimonas gracilis TaxID=1680762 RepID=A0A139SPK5_9GAMM|nr:AEC family transporter [Ventosimonas gracilis]KXU36452.1 hypothetical protein AXE65_04980 [Ventosimonas gracilis]